MTDLPNQLKPIELRLDQLLLDPNNPRFSELGEELNQVQEGRFADERVQQHTFERMKDPLFDVVELRDTIKTLGFLPMDRIVVRRWKGQADPVKYVVIEGNRRVTALKWLFYLHEIGKETLTDTQIANYTRFQGLLLDDEIAAGSASLILPGLRHVSGVKEWGAYQKAKAIHALRRSGISAQESAQSFGLSTRTANSAYRCFLALEAMKQDEEYGEFAQPKLYSYFEEVFKRATLRSWLGWDDNQERFLNEEKIKEFYGWITPRGDGDSVTKLPESKSVRDLSQILLDDNALAAFRSPEGTLARAIARYEVDHPEDWFPKILAAISAVKSLTPDMLRSMDETSLKAITDLKLKVEQTLEDRERLKA